MKLPLLIAYVRDSQRPHVPMVYSAQRQTGDTDDDLWLGWSMVHECLVEYRRVNPGPFGVLTCCLLMEELETGKDDDPKDILIIESIISKPQTSRYSYADWLARGGERCQRS